MPEWATLPWFPRLHPSQHARLTVRAGTTTRASTPMSGRESSLTTGRATESPSGTRGRRVVDCVDDVGLPSRTMLEIEQFSVISIGRCRTRPRGRGAATRQGEAGPPARSASRRTTPWTSTGSRAWTPSTSACSAWRSRARMRSCRNLSGRLPKHSNALRPIPRGSSVTR